VENESLEEALTQWADELDEIAQRLREGASRFRFTREAADEMTHVEEWAEVPAGTLGGPIPHVDVVADTAQTLVRVAAMIRHDFGAAS
jgi:hypothetical protein